MIGFILIHVLTLVASVGALRFPLLGLGTYVLFAFVRPHFLFGWAGDLSGISYMVGLATVVGWVFGRFGNWRFGRAGAAVGLLALYGAWNVVASFAAVSQTVGFNALIVLAKFAIPVLVGVTLLDRVQDRRRMLWLMVLAMGYVGFEMHIHYVLRGFNHAHEQGFGGMDNNCFGAALATMLGPAVALAITSRKWYERAAASAAGLLILHTALLTFSRGTMLGLLAVGAVAVVMMPKRPKYMAALLVVALITIRLTGPQLLARYSSAFADEEVRDGSAQSRVDLWRDCLRVVAEYPILGVGPANWRVIAAQYGWTEGKSAHSVWMETAAELGIPGATFLLLFFLVPAARLWRVAREKVTDENRDDVALAIAVVLGVTGFAVSAQFVSVPGLENPYYLVMTGIALIKARSAAQPATALARASASTGPDAFPSATRPRVPVPAPITRPRRVPSVVSGSQRKPILDLGPQRRPAGPR